MPIPGIADSPKNTGLTHYPVADQSGVTLDSIVVSVMPTATLRVQDDEQARIVISQHLPGSASKDDTVRLLPEVEILGVTPSGGLQVQQNDNRLRNIVISPVADDNSRPDSNVTQHGLLYELANNVSVSSVESLSSARSGEGVVGQTCFFWCKYPIWISLR